MTDPGKYRHRVRLLSYDGTKDELGGLLLNNRDHWTETATVWASIDPISGKEFYVANVGQEQSQLTHKIRMRYREGVTSAMRLGYGTRTLEIVNVIDWEERHESLLLMCKELVE